MGKFSENDSFYQQLKQELEKEIINLQSKANEVPKEISNLNKEFDKIVPLLTSLSEMWASTDIITKKELQYLIFPGGLRYDYQNRQYLTKDANSFLGFSASFSKDYEDNKKGSCFSFQKSPLPAERGGFEPPVHFWAYDSLANCSFRPLRHLSNL